MVDLEVEAGPEADLEAVVRGTARWTPGRGPPEGLILRAGIIA